MTETFFNKGWCKFPYDPALKSWVDAALPAARQAVTAPDNAEWQRCDGTWFVGVHALPNDDHGRVNGGVPLSGSAIDFICTIMNQEAISWDRAQISICYPGYPKPAEFDTDASFEFRKNRDAAHVDGLSAEGPERRRHLLEHHSFLIGIPMVPTNDGASPFVIWEGSHKIMHQAFMGIYESIPVQDWKTKDVTAIYQSARKRVFSECERVVIPAQPGEAYVVHRHAVHGMAPWEPSTTAGPDGRMIAYFRPEFTDPFDWLQSR